MDPTIVAGKRAVKEIVYHSPHTVEAVYFQEGKRKEIAAIMSLCRNKAVKFQTVPPAKLDAMTEQKHQGVVAKVFPPGFLNGEQIRSRVKASRVPLLLALDHVQDQGNVGSLARTSYALGLAGIVLTKDRSASLGSRAIKSSAGAVERLPMGRVVNLARFVRDCQSEHMHTYYAGTDENCHSLYALSLRWPALVVLGNEEKGVRPGVASACEQGVYIPMPGGFDSLNVAQSGGIILGEMLRQWLRFESAE